MGNQIGLSDPVYAKRFGLEPKQGAELAPKFPYDPAALDAKIDAGDEAEIRTRLIGLAWAAECSSGLFREWDSVKFVQDHWDGPLVLKGIQSVQVLPLPLLSMYGVLI